MPGHEAQAREIKQAALKIYDDTLRAVLEPQHLGEIIAIEPTTGEYLLGKTFQEVVQGCGNRFGSKLVYIFRVGGGGAVSIGRTLRRDGLHR